MSWPIYQMERNSAYMAIIQMLNQGERITFMSHVHRDQRQYIIKLWVRIIYTYLKPLIYSSWKACNGFTAPSCDRLYTCPDNMPPAARLRFSGGMAAAAGRGRCHMEM